MKSKKSMIIAQRRRDAEKSKEKEKASRFGKKDNVAHGQNYL
jgi:hypothetical protein